MKTKELRLIIAVMVAYFLCLVGVLSANAQEVGDEEQIVFGIDDPPGDPGHSKTPILMPTLWQSGYRC